MPLTPNHNLSYPSGSQAPNVPLVMQTSMESVDAALTDATDIKHVEFVRVNQTDAPGSTQWGPGQLSGLIDTANSFNYSDWLSYPANDYVRITEEGLYSVQWKMVPHAQNTLWFGIGTVPSDVYQGPFGRVPSISVPAHDSYWSPQVTFYVPPAGQQLCFQFVSQLAGSGLSHRIKITKLR